jgi:hypothetical protein
MHPGTLKARLAYGNTPVPWTVAWSEEGEYHIGECRAFGVPAICQRQAQGVGTPRFGEPHNDRQRWCMARSLCDLCARPLRNGTKISLSNFVGNLPPDAVLPCMEPLLHAECARISVAHCPALRRQLRDGRLVVRQVFRFRARPLRASPEHIEHALPGYVGPPVLGLAAVDLLSWLDVTPQWLDVA